MVKKKAKFNIKEQFVGYLFILPALLFFLIFVFYPTINTFRLSFFQWDLLTDKKIVFFDNYKKIFIDDRLGKIVLNTLLLSTFSVIIKISLGTILAYFVFRIKNKILSFILEASLFLPIVLPMSVVSIVFLLLFNTDIGAINGILHGIGFEKIHWLDSSFLPMVVVLIIDVWKGIGFFFIISLVAMREIPKSYLEAADLDGASSFQKFKSIVIPCISASTFFLIVNALITSIQIFEPVYLIMRDGGPGDATTTISYYIWKVGLHERNIGYGSALAVILFVFIMGITISQFIISKKKVYYDK